MSGHTTFVLETILFEGGVLAWALWEFWSVRPGKQAKATQPPPTVAPDSPEDSRHPEGEHGPHDR